MGRFRGRVRPDPDGSGPAVVGAARGNYELTGCLQQGIDAGTAAAVATGFPLVAPPEPPTSEEFSATRTSPLWLVPAVDGDPSIWDTHFVDQNRDAAVSDVWRSIGAGMRSVEHVKRYTTIGTGSDQGKTSGVNAIGVIADALMAGSPAEVATTPSPPWVPDPTL